MTVMLERKSVELDEWKSDIWLIDSWLVLIQSHQMQYKSGFPPDTVKSWVYNTTTTTTNQINQYKSKKWNF